MKFEYDPKKSESNLEKHGISLEKARELWDGPFVQGPAQQMDEERWMIIGKLGDKLYTCIFTMRHDTIRLISARRSRKNEEEAYHAQITKEV